MNALNMLIDASVHPISSSAREMALLVSVQPRVWSEHWSMCFWVTWTRIFPGARSILSAVSRSISRARLLRRHSGGPAGEPLPATPDRLPAVGPLVRVEEEGGDRGGD